MEAIATAPSLLSMMMMKVVKKQKKKVNKKSKIVMKNTIIVKKGRKESQIRRSKSKPFSACTTPSEGSPLVLQEWELGKQYVHSYDE